MANITCGDNTGAFGGNFLTINLTNNTEQEITISKAVFACGPIRLEFENPTFPLTINLTEEQTSQLGCKNNCFLAVWDDQNRMHCCVGTISFNTNPRKV